MKQAILIVLISILTVPVLAQKIDSEETFFSSMESNRQWPSYRGYYASGYLDDAALPDSFNLETSHSAITFAR